MLWIANPATSVQFRSSTPRKDETMYGIKIQLAVDDYVWVCDSKHSTVTNPKPLLFSSKEKAHDHASIWGPLAIVKRYEESVL